MESKRVSKQTETTSRAASNPVFVNSKNATIMVMIAREIVLALSFMSIVLM